MNPQKGFEEAQYVLNELIESFQQGKILEFILQLLIFPFEYLSELIG